MEYKINQLDESTAQFNTEYPKIYSHKAIWGFSVFFSAIFGAVMLMQNLKDIGKRKEANIILILSILYTVLSAIIVNLPEKPMTGITLLVNAIGGAVLSSYYYKKYFPSENKYKKKKIWKPLIISLLITVPLLLINIYA